MRFSNSRSPRLRQCVAALAIVLVASSNAAAQTLFERSDAHGSMPSRPFRVSFDVEPTSRPGPAQEKRLAQAAMVESSGIQFRPPRRKYGSNSSPASKQAQRLTASVALGVLGFLAGGVLVGNMTRDQAAAWRDSCSAERSEPWRARSPATCWSSESTGSDTGLTGLTPLRELRGVRRAVGASSRPGCPGRRESPARRCSRVAR